MASCKGRGLVSGLRNKVEQQDGTIQTMEKVNIQLQTEVKMLREQVTKLEAQLVEERKNQQSVTLTAISRPTTNVKNLQINNLTPLLSDEMRSHIPMLTHDHIRAGAAGLAQYAIEYPLRDKVVVVDASRRKLKWKNESETIIEDLEGAELCKKFFEVHKEDSRSKILELMNEIIKLHAEATDNEDEETIKICDDRICKLHDLRRGITRLSRGERDDLGLDFVKEVCVKLGPTAIEL
jgi:hypothetical protein